MWQWKPCCLSISVYISIGIHAEISEIKYMSDYGTTGYYICDSVCILIILNWLKPYTHIHTQHAFWTDHPCIFTVMTAADTNPPVTAISKACFISTAAHIIQEDISSPRVKDASVVCISDCYSICKLCNLHVCTCISTTNTICLMKVWHVLLF